MASRGDIFRNVPLPRLGKNYFDLSHDMKVSFRMGELVPTVCLDVNPGETFKMSVENMLRFAPLVSPVMHRVHVTTHFFFVPNRIIWPTFEDWIIGEAVVEPPQINMAVLNGLATMERGSLGDYFGLPINATYNPNIDVSTLPLAAYVQIYNDYYRSDVLEDPIADQYMPLEDGFASDQLGLLYTARPFKRAWNHDYFTSALPYPQAGDKTVEIPTPLAGPTIARRLSDNQGVGAGDLQTENGGQIIAGSSNYPVYLDPTRGTINDLRRAIRLQEWLERLNRGGKRYRETILSFFGKHTGDARLDRAEYLGGAKQNMIISEVLSTAQTETTNSGENPVGAMAGHGVSLGGGQQFSYTVPEHGWIIGIINVQPVSAYAVQGLQRKFSRKTHLDYYWPQFANIGEQAIYDKEIYMDQNTTENGVFGYIPRYSEFRYEHSRVAGEMRDSLMHWHLARHFADQPVLDKDFIKCRYTEDDLTRIFAVTQDADHIYAHIYNKIGAVRPIPRFGVPTI